MLKLNLVIPMMPRLYMYLGCIDTMDKNQHAQLDWIGILLVLTSAFCFSLKAIFVKLIYEFDVPTLSVLFLRLLFSLPFYLAMLAYGIKRNPDTTIYSGAIFLQIFFLGFIGYYLSSLLDFMGLQHIPAGLERIILYSNPTFVLLLGWFIFKRKITSKQIIATIVCYIGVVLAYVGMPLFAEDSNYQLGGVLVLCAAISYAFYLVGAEALLRKIPVLIFTALTMIASSLAIAVHYGIVHPWKEILSYPSQVYYYALFMAFFSTVIPTLMISEGVKRIGSGNSSIIGGMGPIFTIILAFFILGEQLRLLQYLGATLVIASVIILSLSKRKSRNIGRH